MEVDEWLGYWVYSFMFSVICCMVGFFFSEPYNMATDTELVTASCLVFSFFVALGVTMKFFFNQ